MFKRVAADIAWWEKEGISFGRVAINVSAIEFRCADFADRFLERIRRSGISARSLELEVTETVLLGRAPGNVADIFAKLCAIGMKIAAR